MPGLFDSLQSTARALEAQQYGLQTVGANIANVNTPGYSRREVDFAEVSSREKYPTGGVMIAGVRANRDTFTARRLWEENPIQQYQHSTTQLLSMAQTAVGAPGQALDADLGNFFDAFASLANQPTSGPARQSLILQAQALGTAFRHVSDQWSAVQADADQQVVAAVTDINQYASQIASLNKSLADAGGGASIAGQTVLDQIHGVLDALSSVVQIGVTAADDGQVNVSYAGGALVVGTHSYTLTTAPAASGFRAVIAPDGTDVTARLTSGRIGGLLNVRDTLVPGYITNLDNLAYTLVQQVNTLHSSGFDLNGAAGGNFFSPIAAAPGAAVAVTVNPTVAADVSKVVAAGTAAPGDNTKARALADLRDARILGGTTTLAEGWGNLVYQVGQDMRLADKAERTQSDIVRQLQALRDVTSGVSLDEEAAAMMKFQRAYQANARFFGTIDQTLDMLLNLVRH